MKSKTGKIIIIAAAVILIIAIALVAVFLVGREKGYRTISVSEIFGNVTVENNGSSYPAYKNMTLSDGYAVSTEVKSYTRMLLDDDKYVKLEEESRAEFESLGKEGSGSTIIRLDKGAMTNEITKPLAVDEEYVVNTPNAVLAVRGTFFRVEVETDENGNAVTNVFTYGGTVVCKRILPDGTIVEEEVVIAAGYKTTIKMTSEETIYVVSGTAGENANTEPINPDEIPADDLVEMYDASLNGHKMFMSTEEIWAKITEKDIDVSGYVSKYDGKAISAYDGSDSVSATSDVSSVTSSSAVASESSYTSEMSSDSSLTLTTPSSSEEEPSIVTSVSTEPQSTVTVSSDNPVISSDDEVDEERKTTTTTKAAVIENDENDGQPDEDEHEETKNTTTTTKADDDVVIDSQDDEEPDVVITSTTTTTSSVNPVKPPVYTGNPGVSQTTTTSAPPSVSTGSSESEEEINFITVEGDPSDIPFDDIW